MNNFYRVIFEDGHSYPIIAEDPKSAIIIAYGQRLSTKINKVPTSIVLKDNRHVHIVSVDVRISSDGPTNEIAIDQYLDDLTYIYKAMNVAKLKKVELQKAGDKNTIWVHRTEVGKDWYGFIVTDSKGNQLTPERNANYLIIDIVN